MAIFATPIGKLSSAIVVPSDTLDGALLVYDADHGVFVATNQPTSPPVAISDVVTLGLPAGVSLVSSQGSGTLHLKSIVAGPGISITDSTDSVIISRVLDTPAVSNGDYIVVIDADGDDPGSRFVLRRGVASASSTWTPAPPASFVVDGVWIANDSVSGHGYFETRDGFDFTTAGLSDIDIVRVTGTQVEDGDRFVVGVSTVTGTPIVSRLEFEQTWPVANPGGPRDGIVVEPAPVYAEATTPSAEHDPARLYVLRVYGADFGPGGLGWSPGSLVKITGSEGGVIDGTYRIWQVEAPDQLRPHPSKWAALILDPGTPLPASVVPGSVHSDPSSGPLTLTLVGTDVSTGFSVDDTGAVTARKVTVTDRTPTAPGDLASKEYVDNAIANGIGSTVTPQMTSLEARVATNENAIADLRRRLRSTYRDWLGDLF